MSKGRELMESLIERDILDGIDYMKEISVLSMLVNDIVRELKLVCNHSHKDFHFIKDRDYYEDIYELYR